MEPKIKEPFWQPALEISIQVSAWIAGPIVLALFAGKWLDKKYESEPWLFLGCIGLAFIISCYGIVKISLNYIKKIEKEIQDNKLVQSPSTRLMPRSGQARVEENQEKLK